MALAAKVNSKSRILVSVSLEVPLKSGLSALSLLARLEEVSLDVLILSLRMIERNLSPGQSCPIIVTSGMISSPISKKSES